MSRPLRIQYPDAWYHVMNRGRRGESVFLEKQDYSMFVELLKEVGGMYTKPRNVAIFFIRRLRADRRLKARVKNIEKILQTSQQQICPLFWRGSILNHITLKVLSSTIVPPWRDLNHLRLFPREGSFKFKRHRFESLWRMCCSQRYPGCSR